MSIYFSEKFKQLRKANDLTQDQIADIFHVSPKCVSRWETGSNYPDVELLPHLAIYFKVTLDELLGTQEIRSDEKAKEYIKDIRNMLNSGKLYESIETARKAVKEYPLNYNLQYHLLQALTTACSDQTPGAKENTEKFKGEIISLGERVMNNSPNNWGIKVQLIRQYARWDMAEEARKILDTLPPEIWDAEEIWKGCILEGEEWKRHQQVTITRIMVLLCHFVNEYATKGGLNPLQKIECIKTATQIENLIAPITADAKSSFHDDAEAEDYVGSAFRNVYLAELYCEAGDSENALDYVEKSTQDSMHHIEQMDKTNDSDGGNYMAWSTPRNLPWILWEDHLMKPQFDIIRNDERFIKCFELLKANSKELK